MRKRTQKKHTHARHWRLLRVIRCLFGPFFRAKYRFKAPHYQLKEGGPYLILASHTVAIDPVFLDLLFDFPIYFVATEQILNKGFTSAALRYIFAPLAKSKSIANIKLITDMKKIFDEGGNVGIFPEGEVTITGETKTLPESIGKLVKVFKRPVIIVHSYGLYFSNARWSRSRKYGPSGMAIQRIIKPEEYEDMTVEETTTMVNQELYQNAYEQRPIYRYKGKKRAEGLERLIFVCPKCHGVNTLKTKKHKISCQSCDYEGVYDEFGYVNTVDERKNLINLDKENKVAYIEYLAKNYKTFKLIHPTKVYFYDDPSKSQKKKYRGRLEISLAGVTIVEKGGEIHQYNYEQIISFAMQFKNRFLIYVHGGPSLYLEFAPTVSTYQILLTLQVFQNYAQYLKGEQQDAYLHNPISALTLGV